MNQATKIGYIYACIAGDRRYTSRLQVVVDGDYATITLEDSAPIGGMDGPGGTHPMEPQIRSVTRATAKDIVKFVKLVIDEEQPSVIKRYGTPSKKFVWVGTQRRGLSVAACQEALDALART